jgi:hypothetical protein
MTEQAERTAAEWDAFYGRKPSPGPWKVVEHPKQGIHVMFDPRPTTSISVCRVYIVEGDSQRPNARLIAAAPELLAALHLYVDHFAELVDGHHDDCEPCIHMRAGRAAIAKAEGCS